MKRSVMTKMALAAALTIMCFIQSNAQTAKDIVNSETTKITWLGMDFSSVKYVGVMPTTTGGGMYGGATAPFVLKDQINNINEVFVGEMDKKYKLKEAIHKKEMPYTLKYAKQWNANLERENVLEESSSKEGAGWTEDNIKKIVSKYNFGDDVSGIGLVFIWEKMNKTEELGTMWVTFINTNTKEVIFTERMTGKPRGFGFRNYWLGASLEMINDINFKAWKKKYGGA
jgi:hypothetical protein